MIICATVDDEYRLEDFSKATMLVLVDSKGNIVHTERNPAPGGGRVSVARRCVELGADIVVTTQGSVCYPSYMVFKRSGVKVYIAEPGVEVFNIRRIRARPLRGWDVLYSSMVALVERTMGHLAW